MDQKTPGYSRRTRIIYNHYILIICASFLLTAASLFFVKDLGLKTNVANLLPETFQSVITLEEIKEKVGGVGSLTVALEGSDFENLKKAIDLLAPRIEQSEYVNNVEFKRETEFLRDNALIFANHTELVRLEKSIREKIAKEKLKETGMYFELGSDDDNELQDIQDKYEKKAEKEYYTNDEKTIVAMQVYPAGTTSQLQFVRNLFADVQRIVEEADLQEIDHTIQVLYSGSFKNSIDENDTIISDVLLNVYTTIPAIILLVSIYFRQFGGFAFIFIPLAMSISWTFGLTEIVYDDLNSITAFLFIVLFGLGIDYGIHSFARYLEVRRAGDGIRDAVEKTVTKTGRSIFTSAITTSVAFFTLMINDFQGFSQFGFISGFGILSAYFAMTVVFPAFLVAFDKMKWIRLKIRERSANLSTAPTRFPVPKAFLIVCGLFSAFCIFAVSESLFTEGGIEFEYDFKELRSNLPASQEVKDKISDIFDESSSPAIVLSDSRESSREIVGHFRKMIDAGMPTVNVREGLKSARDNIDLVLEDSVGRPMREHLGSLAGNIRDILKEDSVARALRLGSNSEVLTLHDFLKSTQDRIDDLKRMTRREEKIDSVKIFVREARKTVEQFIQDIVRPTVKSVKTLYTTVPDSQDQKMLVMARIDTLVESDAAALVKGKDRENLDDLKELLAKRKRIGLEDIPRKMVERFIGKDGTLGEFVFVFPRVKLRDGREAIRFSHDVHEIDLDSGNKFFASSSNIVFADMLEVMFAESRVAVGLALLAVFLLVLLDVRSVRATFLILTPLVAALFWMAGIMHLFDIKLNFFNIVVIPSVIGIGIDNGVHIFHRYREEGPGSLLRVLRTTGLPVSASVITTMLGFFGLVFAQHNGLNSIGDLAVIGLSMTLVAALTLLPALLQFLEDRRTAKKAKPDPGKTPA